MYVPYWCGVAASTKSTTHLSSHPVSQSAESRWTDSSQGGVTHIYLRSLYDYYYIFVARCLIHLWRSTLKADIVFSLSRTPMRAPLSLYYFIWHSMQCRVLSIRSSMQIKRALSIVVASIVLNGRGQRVMKNKL